MTDLKMGSMNCLTSIQNYSLKKFCELQLNEIRKTMHKQNEKCNEDVEIIKKKVLQLRNTVTELKNLTENFNSKVDQADQRINKLYLVM